MKEKSLSILVQPKWKVPLSNRASFYEERDSQILPLPHGNHYNTLTFG